MPCLRLRKSLRQDIASRESPCPRSRSSVAAVVDEGGIFRRKHPAFQIVTVNLPAHRFKVRHLELARLGARCRHEARDDPPALGQFHGFPFLDPAEDAGEAVAENRWPFHRRNQPSSFSDIQSRLDQWRDSRRKATPAGHRRQDRSALFVRRGCPQNRRMAACAAPLLSPKPALLAVIAASGRKQRARLPEELF